MNPKDLTVYESPFNKIRVGKHYDGGYVITEMPEVNYGVLISGGIADDISFENDLCNRYNINCFAFDGTINNINNQNNKIKYIKKNIGLNNNEIETNLSDLIDEYDNIFLKMDIEGHELDWFKSLTIEQLSKFSQMVVEFHFVFEHENIFNKLSETHYLLHFHANNCCHPLVNYKGVNIPNVFECTFINKKHIDFSLKLNKEPLPTKIDMPNVIGHSDFYFDYPPFVN